MGKSFVLKGLSGRPGGYVMQAMGTLRVKASGMAGRSARLTALYEGGRSAAFDGEWPDGERALPDAGGRLIGAYLTVGGALALHTGDAAREAYARSRAGERMKAPTLSEKKEAPERARAEAQGKMQAGTGEKKDVGEEAERAAKRGREERTAKRDGERARTGEGDARDALAAGKGGGQGSAGHSTSAGMAHELPQRRWPPPPCMPAARYVCGRWEG